VRVAAEIQSLRTEDDVAAVTMTLADGVVVQSLFSFGVAARDEWTVYGDRGVLHLDRYASYGVSVDPPHAESRPRAALRRIGRAWRGPMLRDRLFAPGRDPSFRAALVDFAAAVRGRSNGDRPLLADGCRSLEVVLAAESSSASGRPVEIAGAPAGAGVRSRAS
jgi:predicted dehydrogenase